ncbi:hypothetical protein E2C01_082174 [Portunus trituberculatus]|uniref:Uncharacterized protein n=1 Tax=Portunus trituberculatus TaxID=210409 RepID=A0A5B7J042_PORTR|nr:hypothetical protein [Portunus trituberculatus]
MFFHYGSPPSSISLPFTSESAIVQAYPATSLGKHYPKTPDTNCYELPPKQQGHPHSTTKGQGRAPKVLT